MMEYGPRRLSLVIASASYLALCSPALATDGFPEAIRTKLGLERAPDCTICHVGTPGAGTVTTPFGQALRARGLRANDTDSLIRALDALLTERVDSDGDGVSDIEQLKSGRDPNEAARDFIAPIYGCSGHRQGVSQAASSQMVAALVAAALLFLRRRNSSDP